MQRRTLVKLGFASALALGLAGGVVHAWRPGLAHGRLADAGRTVFDAVARAVLDGTLPAEARARDAALAAHLQRLDATLQALPAATQAELSQLLGLLASTGGRVVFARLDADWPDASVPQVQAALASMRGSRLALRQQAYHALRDLTNAAYFSDPAAWPPLGYPGPRDL